MPCDQVRQTTVQWTEATNLDLVRAALEKLGARVSVYSTRATVVFHINGQSGSLRDGQLTVPVGFDVNELKREYAELVIDARFTEMGWEAEETNAAPAWARGF